MSQVETSRDPGPGPERTVAPNRWQTLLWWLLSALAVELIPSFVKFHRPAWNLGTENEFQVLAAGMALLAAALAYEAVGQSGSRTANLIRGLLFTLLAFGVAAALVTFASVPLSRLTYGISCVVALSLMALRISLQRWRWAGTAVLALIVIGFGLASLRTQIKDSTRVAHVTVPTEFYRVGIDAHPVTNEADPNEIHGGALATLGDMQILSTRKGDLFLIHQPTEEKLRIDQTGLRVPVAIDEFVQFSNYPTYVLRVTGLAAARNGNEAQLYAVYDAWSRAGNCFTTHVSKLGLTLGAGSIEAAGEWTKIFESKPCLEATTGYDSVQTGGRIAIRADGRLLLTLGDHGINGLNGIALAEQTDNDYGKVIVLDADGRNPGIYSVGHRNPQGLTVATDGRVWETEHGPQGGDEINLLVAGANYGWPSVSYGTDYGHFVWPHNPSAHDHGERTEPALAFVPSIGISNLVESHSSRFPAWEGDLIVSSLKAEALYRVRHRDSRVVYAEPIPVGHRIRDLVWNSAGDLILWTDDGFVVRVAPATQASAYDQCSGCHEPRSQLPALGPPLRSIFGRKVADHFEFGYSPALRALGGRWTESRLDEFLRDPGSYAPGTTMTFRGVEDDAERAEIIQFLKDYE